jgi:HK97 family phage prohead protease
MQAPDIDLVRALPARPEFRDDSPADGGLGTMAGHFSVFDTWYRVESLWEGEFLERVAPGTFAQTIADDLGAMRVLFDHGYDPTVGNKVLGPIESLAEDKTGPAYEVPLFDTSYNRDLLPGLRAGVYGSSFRFRVQAEEWDDEPKASKANPKGLPERTITRAKVMEFGPVTFPANPAATAGMRSLTDQFYDRLRARDSQAYDAAVRAAGITPPDHRGNDFTGRPARGAGGGDSDTATAGAGGASLDPYDDPELRHLLLRTRGVIRDHH